MNPDELKQAWQAQDAGRSLTIDPHLLLQQLERNKKSFEAIIYLRDVREVGISLLLIPVWFWMGFKFELPWTWWLGIPATLWVAGFMTVDRVRQRRREPRQGEPLRTCIKASLAQVEHQIWLLRNVFWWYLLPPSLAISTFFIHVAWQLPLSGRSGLVVGWLVLTSVLTVGALTYWGIYRLNQLAVRKDLVPRQHELHSLLASLVGGDASVESAPSDDERQKESPRSSGVGFVIIFLSCVAVAALVMLIKAGTQASGSAGSVALELPASYPAFGDAAVTNRLVPILKEHRVPAIAAALVTSKGVVEVGVAGTRKRGTEVAATLNDTWHLGSDTKAMTATLMAKLVEQGKLSWDTTLAEVFPELSPRFDPEVRTITVLELLSHHSGLPANPDLIKYGGPDGRKERRRVLENELSKPPAHHPGTHYEYSNLGYAIAGAIEEKITGKTWEQAMQDEVFGPLGMKSVGFGGMGTPGQIDQPWPHTRDGKPTRANGPAVDNPPVLSPAGRVHCAIQDWAKFIADQLRGARGEPALLKPESYQKLHTPPFDGDYALGWLVVERSWGGGLVFHHAGDNTMNFANVWIAPKRDFAALACVNQSGDTAFQASDAAVSALIKLHEEASAE